jgi:hypothetical protein
MAFNISDRQTAIEQQCPHRAVTADDSRLQFLEQIHGKLQPG